MRFRSGVPTNADDTEEVLVDEFAGRLLMPAEEIGNKLVGLGAFIPFWKIYELANIFMVSPTAVKYRLIRLGYDTP